MYVSVDDDGRIVNMLNEEIDVPEHDQEARDYLHSEFPVHVANPDFVLATTVHDQRDIRMEGDVAIYDPLPSSLEAIEREEDEAAAQGDADMALCMAYERMNEQRLESDEAIIAIYEAMSGGDA